MEARDHVDLALDPARVVRRGPGEGAIEEPLVGRPEPPHIDHQRLLARNGKLAQGNRTFSERYSLPDADYAAHGGSFPLNVFGTGIVGSVTVSGLPQREDHNLVVEALCLLTGRDHEALRLRS